MDHLEEVVGVVLRVKEAGKVTRIVQAQGEAVSTEMVVDVMDIQVERLGHMVAVDVVEAEDGGMI
jgi:hypothetical protein